MNTLVKSSGTKLSPLDWVKLVLAVALVAAGIFAYNYYEPQVPNKFLRLLMSIGGIVLAALVYLTSSLGPRTRVFLKETRFELRKMVRPTRQQAMQTTWVVVIAVAVISLLLAAFDLIISQTVKLVLGG
ncbi:preprotein translocase subunit SecE [Luteimonas sp. FXH3W]|uniref:Protein translocase subunit SecE n=1 Tax=Aquilutibacter rugosus TaxID=3115820 RepID=A0ABU7V1B7_9GAMM